MKIVVLNGSPKGNISVTLQYVLFIRKKFPQHELKVFNIAQEFRKIEGEEEAFQEIIEAVKSADGVLWAFPLYILLVHSNYKRFIELIRERGVESAFKGKYTAALSTSIHFFDHTAHNYINAICDDLDMRYVGSFSADMYDLLQTKEQDKLIRFAEHKNLFFIYCGFMMRAAYSGDIERDWMPLSLQKALRDTRVISRIIGCFFNEEWES